MVDIYLISVIIFFAILGVLIYRGRKNIQHKYFIFYKRETKRGQQLLDSVVKISPTFWKTLGTVGIGIGFLAMIYGLYTFIITVQLALEGIIDQPALKIILPSPTTETVSVPGIIGIPFWFWIIIIAVVLIPHEFFHGIMARLDKIRVKSVGVFLLAIFPGAFVNPDEKQFEKSKFVTKLRVIAAGGLANIITAALVMLLMLFVIWPSITSPGILINNVVANTPAEEAGLRDGMVIESIDGRQLNANYLQFFGSYSTTLFFTAEKAVERASNITSGIVLSSVLANYRPGDEIVVRADGQDFTLRLAESPVNPEFAYMGVNPTLNVKLDSQAYAILLPLLTLLIFIAFIVAVINLLPIYPLDGGLLAKSVVEKIAPKFTNQIVMFLSVFTLFLLASTIVVPLIV